MKRCWLHIGMHKTGTTSLQSNLKRIDATDEWKYICIGGKLHMNTAFHAMFATDPFKYHWFSKQGISREALRERGATLRTRLAAAIAATQQDTIIMSAEALPLIDRDGIARLKEFLEPLFDEIRVVGYVRPPVSYKISIFQEMVKGGRSRFDIVGIKIQYRRKFEKFDEVFGRDKVTLKKFDPGSFEHGCTVSDFFATLGLVPPDRETIGRANESMTRGACGILFAYRKFGSGYGSGPGVVAENLRLIDVLLAMKGPKFSAARSMVAEGLAAEERDLKWVEDRLGETLSEAISDDGGAVSSERELLEIGRAETVEFAACFERIVGRSIPENMLPAGDPGDPREVAAMVEWCREDMRNSLKLAREMTARRRKGVRGFCNRLFKPLRNWLRGSPTKHSHL